MQHTKEAQQQVSKPVKKTFEMSTSAGKLLVEVNRFASYFFVVVCYAGLLKMDGGIQFAQQIPYEKQPVLLNLIPEQPLTAEVIGKSLSAKVGRPVVLSLNVELQGQKGSERELGEGLAAMLLSLL